MGFEMAVRMWTRLSSSFIMGSQAVVQSFVDDFVNVNLRNDYLTHIQAVEDFLQFLGGSLETEFSRPLVQHVTSRTACPCPNSAYRDHTVFGDNGGARIPFFEVGFPYNITLSAKIEETLRGRAEQTECNRCENQFTRTTITLFHDAPDILFVPVQRRISLGGGNFRKEILPIDIGGD